MTSIIDILTTSNLLENVYTVTVLDMLITLILSFSLGIFIMYVYGRIYQGAMYSGSFAVSLTALTMISAVLILAVTSNLVLSLGMVGALSIVRFRTAIKDPLEIVFLFWAIETGIVLATGIYTLAICVNILIGCALVTLVVRRPEYPYILVLRCKKKALSEVEKSLEEATHFTVKSRKAESQGNGMKSIQRLSEDTVLEMDIEITIKKHNRKLQSPGFDETEFVDALAGIDGVEKAVLVTYNGAYMN